MQVYVSQKWTDTSALRGSLSGGYTFALFHHTGFEPLNNMAYHPPVCNPVRDKSNQPLVVDGVEKTTNVCIEHPVHFLMPNSYRQRIQCIMGAAPRPKPI